MFTRFLKMCGRPFTTIIVKITNASFACEYFLKYLYNIDVIILVKPGKLQKVKQISGVYRLIVLLNMIDKVIETAICRHLSDTMEEYGLFFEGQIDNKVARSIELTIRIVIKAIYTVWQCGVMVSLLEFDIKGAFDTINYIRLLDTLRNKGFLI